MRLNLVKLLFAVNTFKFKVVGDDIEQGGGGGGK